MSIQQAARPDRPDLPLLPALVPEQEFLSRHVASVLGPVEYREWKSRLERIHELLAVSHVEETFQRLSLAQRNRSERQAAEEENRPFYKWGEVEQASYQRLCSQVLRCNVARTLTGESLRNFGCRLAESGLLQWFCKLDQLDAVVRIPGKSALQRYSQWLPEAEMRQVIDRLLEAASQDQSEGEPPPLELAEALDLEAYFLDTTCVKLHIHFPVDWFPGYRLEFASQTLGTSAGRGAHLAEGDYFDSQAELESADGRTSGVLEAHEPVMHEDDACAAEERCQAGT